jgi:hypothetical protein
MFEVFRIPLLTILLVCFSFCTFAQSTIDKAIETVGKTVENLDATAEKIGTGHRTNDTTYIKFYDQLSVHLYSVMYFNSFVLTDLENENTIRYKPVKSPSLGVGFSKYGLTLNLSNDFKLIQESEEKFGETKKFNIKVSFIYKKMWFAGYYSKYKGYYIANNNDFNFSLENEKRPQREDIETMGYGLNYMHVFNSQKFSLNSSYTLTQKQLKSAGSFLVGMGFGGYSIKGDSSLIPSIVKDKFSPYLHAKDIKQQHYLISTGYSYNLVFLKHFNFNVTAIFGLTASSSDLETDISIFNTNNYFDISPSFNVMSALSYVRDRFYSGAHIKLNNTLVEIGHQTGIQTYFISAQVFAGYRIGTRKKRIKKPKH